MRNWVQVLIPVGPDMFREKNEMGDECSMSSPVIYRAYHMPLATTEVELILQCGFELSTQRVPLMRGRTESNNL